MKKLILIILLVFLTGCLGLHAVYSGMHIYAINKLDENFDLNRSQKDFIKSRMKFYMEWQKENELDSYRDFMVDVRNAVNYGATLQDVNDLWSRLNEFYGRSVNYMLPDIVVFLRGLDDSQIEFFMAKKSREDRRKQDFFGYPDKDYVSLSHARQIRQFEKFFGKFSSYQVSQVEKIYDYDKTLARQLLVDDISARTNFRYHMKYLRSGGEFNGWIGSVLVDGDILYTGEARERRDFYHEKQRRRLYEVSKILTSEQKAYFSAKIDEVISEIDKISAD